VSPPKLGFFFGGFEVTYPPFLRVLKLMVHLFLPNLSPFEGYGGVEIWKIWGVEISGGPDR
jgi:hypothetical protein